MTYKLDFESLFEKNELYFLGLCIYLATNGLQAQDLQPTDQKALIQKGIANFLPAS